MKSLFKSSAILFACATALIIGQAANADVIVYQNTNSAPTLRFNLGTIEAGDQVFLAPGPRLLTTFVFEYWGTNFSGNETIKFTLYRNDGPPTNSFATPGSVLFTETDVLLASEKANLTYSLLSSNVLLPDTFTWAVQFAGIGANEAAGIDLTDTDPTIGISAIDYWDHNGGWTLKTNTDSSIAMNFAAQISTVPEPGTIAFAALGVLSLLAFRLRRSS